MTELKPCPFCGGPAELDTRRAYCALVTGRVGDGIAVYCVGECAADMMVCREDVPDIDAEQVVEMWNRRAAAPPPAADAVSDAMVEAGWSVSSAAELTKDEVRRIIDAALAARGA